MITRNRNWILAAMTIATIGTPLFAQEAKKADPAVRWDGGEAIEVAKLSFIDANNLASAIRRLKLPIHVTAVDDKQILLRGQKEILERVLTSIVKVLDVPEVDQEDTQTAILPFPNGFTRSHQFMSNLRAAFTGGRKPWVAVDEITRTLVVKAPQNDIDMVKAVIAVMAKRTRSVLIECFFIRGKLSDATKDDTPLPAHLSSVGKALNESGLTNLELLTPVMIYSREGEKFKSYSLFGERTLREGVQSGKISFSVSGEVQLDRDGQVAKLRIDSQVNGKYANETTPDGKTEFTLRTTVGVPIGDYAILAAAPSSTASGDVIALAVRVTTK